MSFSQKIFHRHLLTAFVVAGSFAILAIVNPYSFFTPIRQFLWFVAEPVAHASYVSGMGIRDFFGFLGSVGSLKRENARLTAENASLQARNVQLENMRAENEQLRQQLQLLPRDQYDLETALVVGGDPNGSGEWIVIDKGSSSGVVPGMPVIVHEGILVGKVEEAQITTAKIRLLSSQKSVVNVQMVETKAKGIVRGRFGLGLHLGMILQTDTLKEGDRAVTSDIGSEYPAGFFIGHIRDIRPDTDNVFQQALVVPPISFSDLRVVSVVKKKN